MNPHRWTASVLAAVAAAVFLAACSNPAGTSGPYDVAVRLYNPTTGPSGTVTVYCDFGVYDASGTKVDEVLGAVLWPTLELTLDSGTYYAKAVGQNGAQTGPYAIAAVVQGTDVPLFGSALADNGADFEDDGPVDGDGVPTNPASLAWEGARNRYLAAGETDWVRFVLP